ncbi:acyltransferase family protein [Enterococcus durans]|uniref:acyltransferase family protein n=1 Tax=Enterococcus durans TaxID=53345 RepID=UPI00232FCF6F|nr:acyltransferase family protein [Enterococcus durans]MDB1653653.1 acyltransferase family protein [Enterococcus durans]MDB1655645.1 acyltransferase family protein [Enterococcus durans]MDB1664478.1 acyltransferase family protein [Enterococcus durans]MDB1669677.1 acyltransferase family protein [Enterococcus durans]MDB1671527.1 acyltransferase family protein [Enterococcus durans]
MEKKKRLKKSRYITGFDGIRSLAVVGVILYHLLPTSMKGGYLGVPIFFVVSGYLITDLLRQEWEQNGKINIWQFYVRRMKRLYPGLAFLLITASAYITLFQRGLLNNLRGVVVSSLLYVNNWWQINNGLSYFDRFANESPFTHIWSLAVEAQNYLIWPVIFVLLMVFVRKRKWIFYTVLGTSVLSAILMMILYTPGGDPTRVYYGTDTRLFSIWMGSALAFVWPSTRLKKNIPKQAKRVLNLAGLISLLALILFFFFLDDHYSFVYYGGMFLVSIFCVILVAVTAHPGASLDRWLTNPVFTWIGKRSYGIYLYQFPVMIFYEAKVSDIADHVLIHTVIEISLILIISELSYRYIERPLARFDYSRTLQVVKGWFKTPIISKQKPWLIPATLVVIVALVGFVTAPKDSVTADQKQLQAKIAESKKLAEESQKDSEKNDGTVDQAILDKYELTVEQGKKAQKLQLTAFGDSVMLDAATDLKEVYPHVVVDGDVGRQLYASEPYIEELKKQNLLKDTVLIGLGTNGAFTEAQFDTIMSALGDRKVYWVNVRVPTKRWQNDVNAMLADMAKKYDNLTLIDWYDYSNGHSDWFYDDQVHPNPEGMKHYIHLVSETLLGKSKTDTKTTKDTTNGNSNTDVSTSGNNINEQ